MDLRFLDFFSALGTLFVVMAKKLYK